jgi:hypothetical protein
MLLSTIAMFSADKQWLVNEYGNKTNAEIVKSLSKTMNELLIKNNGAINIDRYSYVGSVTYITYPPTFRTIIHHDIDKYYTDMKKIAKKEYGKTIKQKNLNKFIKFFMKKTKASTILGYCTQEDKRYLLERGIFFESEFRLGKHKIDTLQIGIEDCNDDEAKILSAKKKIFKDIKKNTYLCTYNRTNERLQLIYSKKIIFIEQEKERWIYKSTPKQNIFSNTKDDNYKIKLKGKKIYFIHNDITKGKATCNKKFKK